MTLRAWITEEVFVTNNPFVISRGTKSEARVVVVRLEAGSYTGWGEGVPYRRYAETMEAALAEARHACARLEAGNDPTAVLHSLPAGAARNALDCALLDLTTSQQGESVADLLGLPPARPVLTAYTLSLGPPDAMAAEARGAPSPLLKLKLGADDGGDAARIAAVREAVPAARLIVDANEGWRIDSLASLIAACAAAGVEMIEQPLPADGDEALKGYATPVPFGADESVHGIDTLERLRGIYSFVNIKLDKTGGLTEAVKVKRRAEAMGFRIMVGSMLATSLSMAPTLLLAADSAYVDLDSPLLLKADRPGGCTVHDGLIYPAADNFWGNSRSSPTKAGCSLVMI